MNWIKKTWTAMLVLGLCFALLPETVFAQASSVGREKDLVVQKGKYLTHQLRFLSQAQKSSVDTLTSAVNSTDTTTTAPVTVVGAERVTMFLKNNWTAGAATVELPDTVFVFGAFSNDGTNYTAWTPVDTVLVAIGPGTINGPQAGWNGISASRSDTTSYRPIQLYPPMFETGTLDSLAATAKQGTMAGVIPRRNIAANRLADKGLHLPSFESMKFLFRINNQAADTTAISAQVTVQRPE